MIINKFNKCLDHFDNNKRQIINGQKFINKFQFMGYLLHQHKDNQFFPRYHVQNTYNNMLKHEKELSNPKILSKDHNGPSL